MKTLFALLAFSFILLFAGCKEESPNAIEYQKINLNFQSYRILYIDSTYKMNESHSFVIFSSIPELFSIFRNLRLDGTIEYPHIDYDTFIDSFAVAVIMPKTKPITISITGITLQERILNVKYDVTDGALHPIGQYYYSIATFKRCDFSLVKFYQNDTLVKIMRYP